MKPFFVGLLVITVGAVIVGYFGTRYVIYPLFIKDSSFVVKKVESQVNVDTIINEKEKARDINEKTNQAAINSNSNNLTLYSVQLGNFGSKENAATLIKELEAEGVFAYILNEQGYKVVTSPVTNYTAADNQKRTLRDFSEDAFVLKRKVYTENDIAEATVKSILNAVYQAREKENGEKYLQELRSVIKESLESQSLEQETVQVFQTMYDEVNKENYKKELFELEKMIIMRIEEII